MRSFSVLSLALFCISFSGSVVAQTGPPVLIKTAIDGGLIGTANGVVLGRHKDHAVVVTNAHVALQATAITVQIGNQAKLAKIINVDAANDFMVLAIYGDYSHLKYAKMAIEVPVGTRLKYCGYLPQSNWQLGCIPTRRIRNDRLKWYAVDMRAVGGMSGGGIYTLDGHLAAILSLSQDGQTQVIPTPVIRKRLAEWGIVDAATKGSEPDVTEKPKKAELAIKDSSAPPVEPSANSTPAAPGGAVSHQQDEPSKPIEKIKDVAVTGAKTYLSLKYGGALAAASAATGLIGWWFGKRIDKKGRDDPVGGEKIIEERIVTVDTPPPKQIVTPEVRYAPYAVDEFSEAFAWAETQMARKYPGSIGTIETLKSMIDQFLTSKKERREK